MWSLEFLRNLPSMTSLFPDGEDLTGSAIALFRLIDTYALDANEVALGNILAKNNSPPLTGMMIIFNNILFIALFEKIAVNVKS